MSPDEKLAVWNSLPLDVKDAYQSEARQVAELYFARQSQLKQEPMRNLTSTSTIAPAPGRSHLDDSADEKGDSDATEDEISE